MKFLLCFCIFLTIAGCNRRKKHERIVPLITDGTTGCDSVSINWWGDGGLIFLDGKFDSMPADLPRWVLFRIKMYNKSDGLLNSSMILCGPRDTTSRTTGLLMMLSSFGDDEFSWSIYTTGINPDSIGHFGIEFVEGYE